MKFRWRIRQKLAVGLVLIAVMTGLLSAGSFWGLWSYRQSNNVFNYHQQQLERLGNLTLTVSELNLPPTSDQIDDADQQKVVDTLLARLNRVDEMATKYEAGLDNSLEAVSNVNAAEVRAELATFQSLIHQLKRAVSDNKPSAVPNRPHKFLWGVFNERELVLEMVNSLQKLRGMIHEDVTNHVVAAANAYRLSLVVVCTMSVLVVALMCVLVWFVYGAIFQPIRELHRGVTNLGDANFDSRVALNTGDEMQELGESFNAMADRLQGIYKDLNRQVEERSRQLIRSERLASVGFLAAGVAHEINNPLASIAFCGEALESRLADQLAEDNEDTEVVHNYLQMIQQEAFRCKAITEKLLDYSRVGEPERLETDMVALIRNVIDMVQHTGRAESKHVVFEPTNLMIAAVNPQELKQVLLNLIVNALEAVDEGGTVTVSATDQDGTVRIDVSDDGCGMDDEVLENLFEPFFTRNRSGKGTGLGLSISHLIISQHGGELSATSAGDGAGSTFTIELPTELPLPTAA